MKQLLVRLTLKYLKPAVAAGLRQGRWYAVRYARRHPWLVGTTCVCAVILVLIATRGQNPTQRAERENGGAEMFDLVDLGDATPIAQSDGVQPAGVEQFEYVVTADASDSYHSAGAPGGVRHADFHQSGGQHADGPVLMMSGHAHSGSPRDSGTLPRQSAAHRGSAGTNSAPRGAAWLTGHIEELDGSQTVAELPLRP